MLSRNTTAMTDELQVQGNDLLIQRSSMASSQIEAFIYVNTGLIQSNAYMISEALDH